MDYVVKESSMIAIADAIRAQSGSGEQLSFPDGFISAVESIDAKSSYDNGYSDGYTAGGVDAQWWTDMFHQKTSISEYFRGTQITTIPVNLDFGNVITADNVCRDCKKLESLPYINTVNATSVSYFVYMTELLEEFTINIMSATNVSGIVSYSKVKRLNLIGNFSTVKMANNMCLWGEIEEIRAFTDETMQEEVPLDLSNVTTGSIFNYAPNLSYIRLVPNSVYVSLNFYGASLTAETVQSIIDGLADLTDETAQTLTFSSTIKNTLTEEQIATITSKNWTLA